MSQLSQKLHYKLDGTTDEITLYSTEEEAGSNPATFGMNGIKCYAATDASSDSNSSRMNYKDSNGARKILKQAASTSPAHINCLAYRCDETTLIQALPVQKLKIGQTFYINDSNAPSISGYNFICAIPNNFTITEDIVSKGQTVKVYYIPSTVEGRNRTNWNYYYQDQTFTDTDLFKKDFVNTAAAILMSGMFQNTNIVTPPKLNMSKVTTIRRMFYNCTDMTEFDSHNYDMSNITDAYEVFRNCTITKIDLSMLGNKVNGMIRMFLGNWYLTDVVFPKDLRNCTTFLQMFQSCSSIASINMSNMRLDNLTNMSLVFYLCIRLTQIDFRGTDFSNVQNWARTFHGCSALTTILTDDGIDMSNATDVDRMFEGCPVLTGVHLKNVPRTLDLSTIGGTEGETYIIDNYID